MRITRASPYTISDIMKKRLSDNHRASMEYTPPADIVLTKLGWLHPDDVLVPDPMKSGKFAVEPREFGSDGIPRIKGKSTATMPQTLHLDPVGSEE